MTLRINGKEWKRDGNEWYEGETLSPSEWGWRLTLVALAALGLLVAGLYPWVPVILKTFFGALLGPFGVRV